MLAAMLQDKAFYDISNPDIIGDVGYLPSDYEGYFSSIEKLDDTREKRLTLTYNDQQFSEDNFFSYILNEVYPDIVFHRYISLTSPTDSDMALVRILWQNLLDTVNNNSITNGEHFTVSRDMDMELYYDSAALEEKDRWYITQMTDYEKKALFNICERVFLGHLSQESLQQLDSVLTSGNNDSYYNYVPNSIQVPYIKRLAHIYDGINIDALVSPYMEFDIAKGGGYSLHIKIWISSVYFKKYYPFSVISVIAPPADCTTLFNLQSLPNIYQALYESRETTYEALHQKIVSGKEYSGILSYSIPYNISGNSYDTVFLMLYKGMMPSDLVIKSAIRSYIQDTCINTNKVGTLDQWRAIYPSLFTTNIFYIYPFFDQVVATANHKWYSSIATLDKVNSILTKLPSSNLSIDNPLNKGEILTAAYNTSLMFVCRDRNNQDNVYLQQLYPDYARVTSLSNIYELMNPATREFIIQLNKGLAKACGETNELTTTKVNGYDYVKFYVDLYEFLMMTENSYNVMIST